MTFLFETEFLLHHEIKFFTFIPGPITSFISIQLAVSYSFSKSRNNERRKKIKNNNNNKIAE